MAIRELFDNSLNGWDFDSDLTQHPAFKNYDYNHTDLPKLKKGHVGGQVILTWCVYNIHPKSPSPFWSLSKFGFYEGHE